MGVAALVLGIISIVIGFIPFCGAIAFIPAVVGLILGIVDIVKKGKSGEKKGMSIAGTILSGLAILVIIYWIFVVGAVASSKTFQDAYQNAYDNAIESSYDYNY